MSDDQPSDAAVIERCQRGEVELFSVLVERYQDRVYNLAFRLLGEPEDALDAAQETFVRAYTALERFDLDRPFLPWLFRIATNTCFGVLRSRRTDTLSLDAMEDREAEATLAAGADATDPYRQLERRLRDAEIQRAVLALPEPYRTVVLLRHMEDLSYEAIAEALEMPLGTVKTLLHRARRRLRETLCKDHP